MRDGFVLADKPPGLGSSALVGILRRLLKISGEPVRVGHTGTLDRFANGLMILLVGRATSLADYFLHADKEYRATLQFGQSTDTHDPSGSILEDRSNEASDFMANHRGEIARLIESLHDVTEQIPPAFSALKTAGRRYSDLARESRSSGGVLEKPPSRPIRVLEVSIEEWRMEQGQLDVRFHVSGGTYIRSFARDLSELLGFPVHLAALRRLAIGRHKLDPSLAWNPDDPVPEIQPVTDALPDWPRVTITSDEAREVSHGRYIESQRFPEPGQPFFLMEPGGKPVAWCEMAPQGLNYRRVFL